MFSLPILPPPGDPATALRFPQARPDSPPPFSASTAAPQLTHANRLAQQRRDEERKALVAKSAAAQLAAEEDAVEQRKVAIQTFGAAWIRPPGISKTLQAMNEEEAERLEAEELARQEQNMADLQARQQQEEARAAGQAAAEEATTEHNLDDDIPEAAELSGIEATDPDVSFNEESMVDGNSRLQNTTPRRRGVGNDPDAEEDEEGEMALYLEEAELTGVVRDEEDLGIERDLDDSIPEAGSYQHTDSEQEEGDEENSFADGSSLQDSLVQSTGLRPRPNSRTAPQGEGASLQGRFRRAQQQLPLPRSPASFNLSSSVVLDSSLVSSPLRGLEGRRGQR